MMRPETVLLLCGGLFAVCLPVFGGDASSVADEELFNMSIEDLMEVEVVSASRRAQTVGESAAQVTVITAEDIHYSGLTSIPEILRLAPGVDVQRLDKSRYVVSIRGFQDSVSDRVLVLINGRAANNPVMAGINWESFPVLIEDIARIEIVRGPSGAAWGANAENGVINIITKKAGETEGVFASTTIDEYGDSYTHIRVSDVYKKWSWRLSTGYEDQEDSDESGAGRYTSFKPSLNSFMGYSGFEARDFSRNWRFDFEARRKYEDGTEFSFGVAHSNLETGDHEFVGYFPMRDSLTNSTRMFARVDRQLDSGDSFYVQWFGNYFASHVGNQIRRYSYFENDLEGQYNIAPFAGHEVSFGGNVRMTRISATNGPDIEEVRFHNEPYNEYWWGAFVTDRFDLTDRLTIENQARVDHYSVTDYDWSLRSTGLYGLDENRDHVLRLSFARSFRSPAAGLRDTTSSYLEMAPGSNVYLFNTLRPVKDLANENIWSIEGGYSGLFADGFSVNVNTYYQRYEDIISGMKILSALTIRLLGGLPTVLLRMVTGRTLMGEKLKLRLLVRSTGCRGGMLITHLRQVTLTVISGPVTRQTIRPG